MAKPSHESIRPMAYDIALQELTFVLKLPFFSSGESHLCRKLLALLLHRAVTVLAVLRCLWHVHCERT